MKTPLTSTQSEQNGPFSICLSIKLKAGQNFHY